MVNLEDNIKLNSSGKVMLNSHFLMKGLFFLTLTLYAFQFILNIIKTPTPELEYIKFKDHWYKVLQGNTSYNQISGLAKSVLFLLGRDLKDNEKLVADKTFQAIVWNLIPTYLKNMEPSQKKRELIGGYLRLPAKNELVNNIPQTFEAKEPIEKYKESLPPIMKKHLYDNHFFFSKNTFLGLPLHYWYIFEIIVLTLSGAYLFNRRLGMKSNN